MTVSKDLLKSGKLVAVLGNGLSGQGCMRLLKSIGAKFECFCEKENLLPKNLSSFGLCIYSPGFSQYHEWLQSFYRERIECINEFDFASTFVDNECIAITGTNGKTSVTECLADFFNLSGQKAIAIGNNGVVFSDKVCDGIENNAKLICEVSSFQAWGLKHFSPQSVIFTNIAPDHINYHKTFENYLNAKIKLVNRAKGDVMAGQSLKKFLKKEYIYEPSIDDKKWSEQFPLSNSYGQRENFCILRNFCKKHYLQLDLLDECINNFKQPENRLALVRTLGNVEFWDDSKATNLHAVCSALNSFENYKKIELIIGGREKGEDLYSFAKTISKYNNISAIHLIGESAENLFKIFINYFKNTKLFLDKTLDNIFCNIRSFDSPRAIILTPGFASFDQFKDYKDRGNYFRKLVFDL